MNLWLPGERIRVGNRKLGIDLYTAAIFKMDSQQGPAVYIAQRTLLSYMKAWRGEEFGGDT